MEGNSGHARVSEYIMVLNLILNCVRWLVHALFFYVFCQQYMSNVDSWCKACGEVDLPSELQDLEDAIHHHQGLYEHITTAYSEVRFKLNSIITMCC